MFSEPRRTIILWQLYDIPNNLDVSAELNIRVKKKNCNVQVLEYIAALILLLYPFLLQKNKLFCYVDFARRKFAPAAKKIANAIIPLGVRILPPFEIDKFAVH